ncbi:MAG TPA: PH domain-containing protein [Reyranella sp.]|nr:PH domain-containing protein [Reyranella sp.]
MSYVRSVLQPGERIKVIGKLHWIVFVRAFVLLAIAIALFGIARRIESQVHELVFYAGCLVLLLCALSFLHAWFIRWITELAITDHRVIYKRGFLSRHTVEMNMDKVETVDVDQSILGRILGYGTIRVRGTGQSIENLSRIASPIALRNAITAR